MTDMEPTALPMLPKPPSAAQGTAVSPPASPQAATPVAKPEDDGNLPTDVSTPPLSDADLDAEFQEAQAKKPSRGRPTSQAAIAFSKQLDDMFLIDDNLDKLSSDINRKKQSVSYQSSELAALEARLKAAEMLLRERKKDAGIEDEFPEDSGPQSAEETTTEAPVPVVETKPAPAPEPEASKEDSKEAEENAHDDEDESEEEEEPEPPRRTKRRSKYVPGVNWSIADHGGRRQYQVRPPAPPQAVSTGI
ncbi:hypothetical protein EX30DRAFT_348836 [Ascodesmis nigricans]|uniref:Uncharacterized protein n=1 Tax=Ascodesmis nigricans TaxID=341454 RepID=A0A4S2MX96_9PEZI|nr:hypothetical protein EX30DRAFT_348836 [Ascodesmis nigricans]